MYTHPHLKQENKSQGAAYRVYQKKGNSSSVLQFEDIRPEAIAQHKIQEMIAHSPRVKQMKQMQDIIHKSPQVKQNSSIRGDGIIQRRPLQKGEFNIAGENHLESDSDIKDSNGLTRRDKERAYCIDKIGGFYGTEIDLKNDQNYADPPLLRAKDAIFFGISSARIAIYYIKQKRKKNKAKKLLFSVETALSNPNLQLLNRSVKALREKKEKKELDAYKKIQKEVENLDYWLAQAILSRDRGKKNLLEYDKPFLNRIDLMIKSLTKVKEYIKNEITIFAEIEIKKWITEYIKWFADLEHLVLSPRTRNMIQAYITHKREPGVWKIGEQHIQEIRENRPVIPTTTLDEFNEEFYKKYPEENKDDSKKS